MLYIQVLRCFLGKLEFLGENYMKNYKKILFLIGIILQSFFLFAADLKLIGSDDMETEEAGVIVDKDLAKKYSQTIQNYIEDVESGGQVANEMILSPLTHRQLEFFKIYLSDLDQEPKRDR